MNNELFTPADVVSTYTTDDATSDGILFDIRKVNPQWQKGLFSHVTTSLMSMGYVDGNQVNVANLIDLLNQSLAIVRRESKNFTEFDWFYSGEIELPSGTKQKVFICQNETEKFTLMKPEDY